MGPESARASHELAQINISFRLDAGGRRVSAPLFTALAELLAELRARGSVLCWFVRKDPGLRLRIGGPGYGAHEAEALEALLAAQQRAGRVEYWFASTYEPELERLGGPHLLDAVHRAFSHDTDLWIAIMALRREGATRLSPELASLALSNNLLRRATGASEEAWDIWCALLRSQAGEEPAEPTGPIDPRAQFDSASLIARAEGDEARLLTLGLAHNAAFVSELDAVLRAGRLKGGRRGLLAAMLPFYWNRWALDRATVAAMCRAMVARLHPGLAFFPRQHAREGA
jgi:thiopeptide-type bacteriocin biosynthesis protein